MQPVREVRFMTGLEDVVIEARVLSGFAERLRGLLGTSDKASPVILERCHAIHTFGMGYPIDVAFVSARGKVTCSERGVCPGRHLSSRKACWVLERPSDAGPWPQQGTQVEQHERPRAPTLPRGRSERSN
jgi:hypothetical protein